MRIKTHLDNLSSLWSDLGCAAELVIAGAPACYDQLHHLLAGGPLSHLLGPELPVALPLLLPDIHEAQDGPDQWSLRLLPCQFRPVFPPAGTHV